MVVWASLLFPSTGSGNWREGSGNWGEGGWGFFVVPFDRLRERVGGLRELRWVAERSRSHPKLKVEATY